MLIKHLPPDGAFYRAAAPDVAITATWTVADEIRAQHLDAYRAVHFRSPRPFPRPAEQARIREATKRAHANDQRLIARHKNLTEGT